ncbi:MAG: hypothetical protein NTZ83_04070 [Candidatus Pacearchaeota archaeon]|nr:hypothetical protein [Candidatus Pacearchaeota archaeon]
MNAKPTKKKVIWTLVLALLINVAVPLINWLITTITWPLIQKYLETNKVEGLFGPATLSTLTDYLLSTTNIVVFVVEVIVIYFIWSIFQKKRMPKMPAKK